MMKHYIMTLIFSSFIFTASPLFAMNLDEENQIQSVVLSISEIASIVEEENLETRDDMWSYYNYPMGTETYTLKHSCLDPEFSKKLLAQFVPEAMLTFKKNALNHELSTMLYLQEGLHGMQITNSPDDETFLVNAMMQLDPNLIHLFIAKSN